MQVAVTAAGGEVKKANESHIGIANEITINEKGLHHQARATTATPTTLHVAEIPAIHIGFHANRGASR